VKAWLFGIARNLAFNHLDAVKRRRQQRLEIPSEENEEEVESPAWMADERTPGADVQLERDEQQLLLHEVVEALPQSKREVFYMSYESDMEIREIARELNLPEGTVKSRLFYARKFIAAAWRQLQNEWENE
jgi:RNA polymerase sigma-70 factor (ECF subfamily)